MGDPTDLYPDVFEELVRRRRAGQRCVLITVVERTGSAPRDAGARMLLLADGTTRGTVGGGVREAELLAAAREVLAAGGSRRVAVDFTAGLTGGAGPVCGGRMEVFMERIDPPHRVVIAGAGHVGYFLARVLALLDMHVIVVDPRGELATEERFPGATLLVRPFDTGLDDLGLGPWDGVVIVTPGHEEDEAVLRGAVACGAGYVGMIGSRRKIAEVFARLRADGVAEAALAAVHAPIGLDIGAESPAEIAVAVAAELVATFRAGAKPPAVGGS